MRQIATAVDYGHDIAGFAAKLINDAIGTHQDFAKVVQVELGHDPACAGTQVELSRGFVDTLADLERIARGITRYVVHDP